MRDIRPYRVCRSRTARLPHRAVRNRRFHATIVAQCLQQALPWCRYSLRPFAGRLHGVTQSLIDGAPRREVRSPVKIGKHHAIATAAAIRCVTATPPSSPMCRGRVLRLRYLGERWRGSPRPAAVHAQGQPLTAAGAACGRYLPERLRAGETGPDLFRHACLMGLEGMVSKHRESLYRGGRFRHWIKVKNRQHPAFARVRDQFS